MTDTRNLDRLNRRQFVKLVATGGLTAALAPIGPEFARGQQNKVAGKPATNIADAMKHPRTPDSMPGKFPGRVIKTFDHRSIAGDAPDTTILSSMLARSMLALTGCSQLHAAWRTFVTPDDIVGLKVNPVAGKTLSTSPEIVTVIIRQLEEAGIPRDNIVIWDRREFELQEAGFTSEHFEGVRIRGTEQKDAQGSFYDGKGKLYGEGMIDREWYYWADAEEKYDAETLPYMINEGKESYFSRICTKEVSKIINVPILKNAGPTVTLCLKNLAFGSISNTGRLHKALWHQTCAEVPAFPPLRDKVVLNIVDGIKGCYNGGPAANPEFFTEYKTILVGTDPVAVDRVGYEMVLRKRLDEKIQKEESPSARTFMDLAQGLGLGVADLSKIELETIREG